MIFLSAMADPRDADDYVRVCDLVDSLSGETTAVVLRYLAGLMTAPEAARTLQGRSLMEHPEALLVYVDRYRAYTLAYTWGRDRLLARPRDRQTPGERADHLARLMTSSEWDLGRQQ